MEAILPYSLLALNLKTLSFSSSPVSGGTLPTATRQHHRSSHVGGGSGGNSKRHHSTSSGTDRDRSLRSAVAAAASKRNSNKSSSRTAREKQIRTTRMDSSDSSDEGAAAAAGRTKPYSGETLSKRRNSKEHLLKRSSAQTCSARDGRGEPSNRSDDSPRPRSNSSGKDKSSAGAPHVGSKSPSPRHEKTEAGSASGPPPPLPPKGVRKAADAHAEQCPKSEAAGGGGYALPNKPQSSSSSAAAVTTTTTSKTSSSFFKDELDFTSSRLESETNKMRFIEEIHRRQERERLRDHAQQQQDRLARELTTTFKLTAGKRLTAKAREMSKSQGDGIDDGAAAVGAVSEQVRFLNFNLLIVEDDRYPIIDET